MVPNESFGHSPDVVRETYADTLEEARQTDAIVTHPTTMAAVLIAQQLRLPWISTVLAPISFLSAYDPPIPAPFPAFAKLRMFGPGVMRVGMESRQARLHGMGSPRNGTSQGNRACAYARTIRSLKGPIRLTLCSRSSRTSWRTRSPTGRNRPLMTGFPFYDGPAQRLPGANRGIPTKRVRRRSCLLSDLPPLAQRARSTPIASKRCSACRAGDLSDGFASAGIAEIPAAKCARVAVCAACPGVRRKPAHWSIKAASEPLPRRCAQDIRC